MIPCTIMPTTHRAIMPAHNQVRAGPPSTPGHDTGGDQRVADDPSRSSISIRGRVVVSAHEPPLPGYQDQLHREGTENHRPSLDFGSSACPLHTRPSAPTRASGREDIGTGTTPAVISPMKVVVDGPVQPRDPHQGEQDREVEHAGPRDVLRQSVRDLRDENDKHQVEEQLDEAHGSVRLDFAVRPWRRGEPVAGNEPTLGGRGRSLLGDAGIASSIHWAAADARYNLHGA